MCAATPPRPCSSCQSTSTPHCRCECPARVYVPLTLAASTARAVRYDRALFSAQPRRAKTFHNLPAQSIRPMEACSLHGWHFESSEPGYWLWTGSGSFGSSTAANLKLLTSYFVTERTVLADNLRDEWTQDCWCCAQRRKKRNNVIIVTIRTVDCAQLLFVDRMIHLCDFDRAPRSSLFKSQIAWRRFTSPSPTGDK